MKFEPLSKREEDIAKIIVDAACCVHKELGHGLLGKVYEISFCHELTKRGLLYQRQIAVPIVYDGVTFDEGLRLDALVENLIICELKAMNNMNPIWETQVLSHLKLTRRLGISKLRFFVVSLLRMALLVILSASEESN